MSDGETVAVDAAVLALIGTICGGVGLKVADHFLGRNKVKIDDATQIRDELRLEVTSQREEIKSLEAEVTKWREEYYNLRDKYALETSELRDKYSTLETTLRLVNDKIKEDAHQANVRMDELHDTPPLTEPR